ncbi:Histone deacetylase complex subunit [Neonectria magnoliae]|uniref:Histone deacetylase complex subunit n=1 Tax=Neonectria magnoliae TaxID=2732573 RepID=A0ABR1HMG9_9HYPO
MAPPSPRRSSRARATNPQSQQSSVTSSTSGRHERSTRSITKPLSNKSTPTASLSSEPLEDPDDTIVNLGRRRKRGQDDDTDKTERPDSFDMVNGSDDLQEEDEAVRCLCGSEDYPGRPPVDGPDADFFAAIELTEDVTGFFVQCDICKVWQHGACVGIFSAESSPDEYFCEQCRKDLHKIHTASNGQKYSKYLPLNRPSRATSRATSIAKEGTRSPKNGSSKNSRPTSASLAAAKRRSTMNSRDRAYDDEQLRRAIEASKEDAPNDNLDSAHRRAKRGRSDSEESVAVDSQPPDEKLISSRINSNVKRQRTSSRSASPPVEPLETPSRDESEDETGTRNGSKKARNGKPQRENTEKDEKERQRQEAATKRKGRAERRRGEDSDPSEEIPVVAEMPSAETIVEPSAPIEHPTPVPPTPDTPPASHPATGSSHKRGGRTNHKKPKGRNQYTKDRDTDNGESPARSMSRDIQKNENEQTPTGHSGQTGQAAHTPHSGQIGHIGHTGHSGHSKPSAGDHRHISKSKSVLPHKLSMMDMKRRVGAIMDFISRTQVDLAAEALPLHGESPKRSQVSPQKTPTPQTNGDAEKQSSTTVNEASLESSHSSDFKELNCMEMMDVLTRDMVKWQNQYA